MRFVPTDTVGVDAPEITTRKGVVATLINATSCNGSGGVMCLPRLLVSIFERNRAQSDVMSEKIGRTDASQNLREIPTTQID